ncbi:hypothetical protein NE398_07770 [Clostridium tertium]|uniref:Uncharacterized protein n=1 Tax=Clostridium tertium TaxID=1559 RepID=A0A9X3XL60_9CLOT|nr:hypothetical protein [Clostridium tertium]MDC4240059.1 hypothetical protein [Clostridium tertium]
MKIKDLNSKAEYIKELGLLKEELKVKYEDLLKINKKFDNEIRENLNTVRFNFEKEAIMYFNNESLHTELEGDIIIARNDNINIRLFNYYDDFLQYDENEVLYKIEIEPINIHNTIVISPCSEDDSMFYWKNVIKIGSKVIDEKNINSELLICDDKNELMKVIEKIDENINHLRISLNNIKNVRYVYATHKYDDVECSTFKELFEKYIE